MRFLSAVVVSLFVFSLTTDLPAQGKRRPRPYPPVLEGATVEVYKTIGDVKLNIYEFFPAKHQASDRRPAIVFFFGGGWLGGSPTQFEKHCKYLAARGMVAMAADYRVLLRHKTKANSSVADAKSTVRWIRKNSKRLGIDPNRIVAAGGSAGGHLAACTGTIDGFDESSEDAAVSSQPNAMILFNPAVVLAPVDGELPLKNGGKLLSRMGVEPKKLSPYHHIHSGLAPTLILHGKADSIVPYKTVEWFTDTMKQAGNRCELEGYAGAGHGFFNYGRNKNRNFIATLTRADEFLVSLGYLQGTPSVEAFVAEQSAK